jgi:hypothetical protein
MKKISDIIEFIKELKGVSTDKDVADLLEMTSQSLFNHKNRGTTPFQNIMVFCDIHQVSYDSVLKEPEVTEELENTKQEMLEEIEALKSDLIRSQRELLSSKNVIIVLQKGIRPEENC